ncbi:putative mitochondrial protein [Tanacetum coccineum]
MVNTRNNSLEPTIDAGIKQWVTDHVDSASIGINEHLAGVNTSIQNLLLKVQYLSDDICRLKKGEGSSRLSKLSKLEVLKFFGKDVKGETVAWNVYEEAILKTFGSVNEDPMAEWKNLRYETSMKEYQRQFEKLLNQVDNTESQSVSMFIASLPASIELNVRMFRPKSLIDAFSLANLQEATLAVIKQRNVPLLPTLKTASGWNVNKSISYPPKNTTTTLALPCSNDQSKVVNEKLSQLLVEYADVFEVSKELLPQRSFDHRIPLKEDYVAIISDLIDIILTRRILLRLWSKNC